MTAHQSTPYQLRPATSSAEVLAAQRLRFVVFEREGGASTPGPAQVDADEFDDICDHLIVWFQLSPDMQPEAVATYRLLPPHANDAHPRSSGLYSAAEFDLAALESLMPATVEAGRCAVHPDHRNGTTMALLWGGIARYMFLSGYRYVIGCASISLADGGAQAAHVWDVVQAKHLDPEGRRCAPRLRWNDLAVTRPLRARVPALLKGYLRLGAVVLGPPACDPDFNTADLLVLLDLERTEKRYLGYFLGMVEAG
ncbi:GNAT family N-acetyltransferase [Nakamurella antarctica]|uniref:GNAT family N-acetyltransferase n=1 Tax=Nakamurella antarctica TaxID=1902245 RepID=A0A3G8ZQ54_9ACTN|nr:GNAT family N-acetyltransferase [Nakamurella antarctica]